MLSKQSLTTGLWILSYNIILNCDSSTSYSTVYGIETGFSDTPSLIKYATNGYFTISKMMLIPPPIAYKPSDGFFTWF